MDLRANLSDVRARIVRACERSGRKPEDVRLVAVTKTVGPEVVRELYDLGVRDVGENRVHDALDKAASAGELPGLHWHMIGHLQRNKVRHCLRLFTIVHSVDSTRLVQALEDEAAKRSLVLPVLVEVNLSGEATKTGARPEDLPQLLDAAASSDHLRLCGLMTMAPIAENPETVRPVFARLREIREHYRSRGYPLSELSMGMTQDFEVAIEEGATMIRVGTALFRAVGVP